NISDANVSGRVESANIEVVGAVSMRGSHFDAVTMTSARIDNDILCAIDMSMVQVNRSIDLSRMNITGHIALSDGVVGRDVFLSATRLKRGQGRPALYATDLQTGGGIYLDDSFESDGGLDLMRADIGGSLYGSGALIKPTSGPALRLDGAKVKSDVELKSAKMEGPLVGRDFSVGGSVFIDGIEIVCRNGSGLFLPGLKVGSTFSASRSTVGGVWLHSAIFGGDVNFEESEVQGNSSDLALSMERA